MSEFTFDIDDYGQDKQVERDDVTDANGNTLQNGDTVQLTQDLTLKGTNNKFKRGETFKNIKLTDDADHVEVKAGKTAIFLKTQYIKKK